MYAFQVFYVCICASLILLPCNWFLLKGPFQPWYVARLEHKSRKFRVTRNYWQLWKAFPKIWYRFERLRLSVGKNCHPFERLWLSVWKRNVIPSNDSCYPFKKTYHPFEQLGLSVGKKMQSTPSKVFERHRLIRSRRIVIRSNSSDFPLEKLSSVRGARVIWKL